MAVSYCCRTPTQESPLFYSSTKWQFRTGLFPDSPIFLTFLGDFNPQQNYHPEDSKHSGSRRIEFSSKSSTIADCEDNE